MYDPPEVVEYPLMVNEEFIERTKAFPRNITCPDDGHFVAFSFANYLYLLDCSGRLVAKWDASEVLDDEKGEDAATESNPEHFAVIQQLESTTRER